MERDSHGPSYYTPDEMGKYYITYIGNSLGSLEFILHAGKGVVVRGNIGDDGLLIRLVGIHIWEAMHRVCHTTTKQYTEHKLNKR